VISDGVLTALRIGMELRAEAAIPVVSMAAEMACASVAVLLLLKARRRAASTEALLER
jgi:hypothetical protein